MKIATHLRFIPKTIVLGIVTFTAWGTAQGQSVPNPWSGLLAHATVAVPTTPSTTKPTFTPSSLCLPQALVVTFSYGNGVANTSTTVKVQVGTNAFGDVLFTQDVTFLTDGSGAAANVQATLNLTMATAGIVGNNRRVRIRNAANDATLSVENSDQFNIGATPTLSGVSQSAAVCAGTNATINLTGLVPSPDNTIRYKIGGGSNVDVTNVASNASGQASFTIPTTAADVGQTLTIVRITNTQGANCQFNPSANNTVALQVRPLPTATLSFTTQDLGLFCSTDDGPDVLASLTGTGPWNIKYTNGTSTIDYVNAVAVSITPNRPPGTYQILAISDQFCAGLPSNSITVEVRPAATASAITLGSGTICQFTNTTVSATFGGGASSGTFSDGGVGGTFNVSINGSTVSGTYAPPESYSGPVTIQFETNNPDGPCQAVSTTAALTVTPPSFTGLTGTPTTAICAGYPVTLNVTTNGCFKAGSTFNVELSNGSGSFTSATLLGTITPGTPKQFTLPNLTPSGTGYKVRVTNSVSTQLIQEGSPFEIIALSIGTPTRSVAELCANASLPLTFGTGSDCDFPSGNVFTAQLSDKDGSFTNPAPTATWTVTPGANALTIPLTQVFGTGYRIRVVSSVPALTSPASEAFQINSLTVAAYPTTPGRVCQGDPLAVTFATLANCPFPTGNAFTVQLSSATGNFANPTVLGTASPGTTNFALPTNLPVGTGYRVRILTSYPATTSSASLPFRLEAPSLSVTPTVSGVPVCRGGQVTVGFNLPANGCPFPGGNAFTAQLSSSSGSFNNPTNLGPVLAGQLNSVTIPATPSAGSGYRIRIVSSNPALTSASSSTFQVKACANRLSTEEPALVVSPNPVTSGEIRCRVTGMSSPQFSLTTSVGRGVGLTVQPSGAGEYVLTPKQALVPGVYVVQAHEGSVRLSQRVLVTE